MGLQDYISETEASNFAGVSAATLSRFVEAGYLKIESDTDGLRLFSKVELAELFGLEDGSSADWSAPQPQATQPEVAAPRPQPVISAPLSSQVELERGPSSYRSGLRESAWAFLDREVSRLKHLTELQERLLEHHERELKDLREQRDWLKGRLEKLEEKGERDQLLLLAETQTIRKLVALEERRKSPVRLALEWLGLSDTQAQSHGTIEVRDQSRPTENGQNHKTARSSANRTT